MSEATPNEGNEDQSRLLALAGTAVAVGAIAASDTLGSRSTTRSKLGEQTEV